MRESATFTYRWARHRARYKVPWYVFLFHKIFPGQQSVNPCRQSGPFETTQQLIAVDDVGSCLEMTCALCCLWLYHSIAQVISWILTGGAVELARVAHSLCKLVLLQFSAQPKRWTYTFLSAGCIKQRCLHEVWKETESTGDQLCRQSRHRWHSCTRCSSTTEIKSLSMKNHTS